MNLSVLKNKIKKIESLYIDEAQKNEAERWRADFNGEIENLNQYREREILELLQNADDAGSSRVDIILNTIQKTLEVKNSGSNTVPFKEEGVSSIMYANLSPKKGMNYIGAKGLGFRSILNWSNHILIRSANMELEFSNDRVVDFWNTNMVPYLTDHSKYEIAARKDHRQVPLSILALPIVKEIDDVDFTSITIHYNPALESQILKDLRTFQPTSLLFLHNLKSILISVDGETIAHYSNHIITSENGFITSELAGKKWISKVESGKITITGNEKDYETGCAYCIDNVECSGYPIYNFFPTRDTIGIPAIMHATLELDSSRNHLIADNETNKIMLDKVADIIAEMAEYLKTKGTTWDAYRLMRPHITHLGLYEYQDYLLKKLYSRKGNYIPLLGGGYGDINNCFYLDDNIFEIIASTESGHLIFGNMRLKEEIGIQCVVNQNFNLDVKSRIEKFASEINKDTLVSLIVSLQKYASGKDNLTLDCHIFKDSDGEIITGRAFINEGQKVEEIPSFMKFDYLDEELAEKIKQRIALRGERPWQRELADKLSVVGKISSSDISSLTNRLLPKSEDSRRPESEYKELMKSLYKIFLKRGDKFTISEGNEAWLPTETYCLQWQRASSLIAADYRFPDGFRNLGISPSPLTPERCVAYPYFLEEVSGGNPTLIQEFLVKLGVNLYFGKSPMHYGSDLGYIDSLDIPAEVKDNCSWKDKNRESLNTAYIADRELLNSLRLPDLINILIKSGYDEQVCAGQQINWFNMIYKPSVPVDLSYAAYLLRSESSASKLKYYAMEDNEWLPGQIEEKDKFEIINDDPRILRLLKALGASTTCSDYSTENLYQVLQQRTNIAKKRHNSKGLKSFYHKIKMALNEKNSVNPPADLQLACRIGDELYFLPSKEIFYSDNIGIRSLKNSLPILEMSSREGEDIVKRVFGCRLIKDLRFELIDAEHNSTLGTQLNQRLATIRPYIIASATKEAGSKGGNIDTLFSNVKGALDRLYINVVSKAGYKLVDVREESDKIIWMENGDLQFFDGQLYISGNYSRLQDALEDPYFCNGIVEAIAITLKLNGGDNLDRFLRLLKSSKKELDYIAENEFDETLWSKCIKESVLSESEVEFWRKVFEVDGIAHQFDELELRNEQRSYLASKLGIDPDRADMRSFITFHKQMLKEVRGRYEVAYLAHIHSILREQDDETKSKYVEFKEKFLSDDWIDSIAERIKYEVEPDYDSSVKTYIAEVFNFDCENQGVATLPCRHDEYLYGHDFYELRLSPKDESLLYFEGYEDYFARKIDLIFSPEIDNERSEYQSEDQIADDSAIIKIEVVKTLKPEAKTHTVRHASQKNHPSESVKKINGRKAEDLVFKAFSQPDSEYEIGEIYSEYLAAKKGRSGDDSKGYDLEYRKKGSDGSPFRCLEIKNSASGEDIRLTAHEYEVAQSPDCCDRYDVALVTGDTIRIWENAFKDPDSFDMIPEGYHVKFKIKTQE